MKTQISREYGLAPHQVCEVDDRGRLYLNRNHDRHMKGVEEIVAFMTYEGNFSYISMVAGQYLGRHLKKLGEDVRTDDKFYTSWHEHGVIKLPDILRKNKHIGNLAAVSSEPYAVFAYNLDEYARHMDKIKKEGFDDLSFLPESIRKP